MAYTPRKNSLFGRDFGIKHGANPRVYATNGIEAAGLFLSTAADGTMVQVDIAGWTSVEGASTGTAALSVRGITNMTSGASTLYTLAAPPGAGVRKTFFATSTSTANRQITSAANIVRGNASSGGGDAGVMVASTAFTVMTFTGLGNCIELIGLSTGAWLAVNVSGYSSIAVPLSS